jgi:oxygen-dependent protoporphyrinogen oxidase
MAALPRALAQQLGDALILSARLTALDRDPLGTWSASWTTSLGETREKFDGVVLAVPAYALSTLPLPVALAAALVPLAKIEHPPVSVALLGYPRHAVGHPLDGFGVLIPAVEKFSVLGVLFNSTLFPGRAPAGQVLLTVFVGGARQPELALLPDAELRLRVEADLQKLLFVTQPPVYQKIVRWPRAIPQYNLGYQTLLEAMDAAETGWPGLALAGSYRGGVSMPQCLESGRVAGLRALNLSPNSGG